MKGTVFVYPTWEPGCGSSGTRVHCASTPPAATMARLTALLLLVVSCHHALGFTARGFLPLAQSTRVLSGPISVTPPSPRRGVQLTAPQHVRRSLQTPVVLSATQDTAGGVDPRPPAPLVVIPAASLAPSPLASGASLVAIVSADFALKKAFLRAGLTFPSSLAGMVGLFAGLVALERAAPKSAEKSVSLLEPGSTLLARWLPVFFVPSLVVLPLSPAPSTANAAKLLLLVCGGWLFSLASTAAVVGALSPQNPTTPAPAASTASAASSKPAPPTFRSPLILRLAAGASASGVVAVLGASGRGPGMFAKAAKPAAQLSMLLSTLFGFTAGTRVPRGISKAVHPLVTCTAVAMATAATIGKGFGLGFTDMLRTYVTKSRCPVHLGAGDLLLGLLGPSVLSFAVQMYRRRTLIFKNAKQVAGGSIFCASSGLFGTALVSRLLGLPEALRLATLPRNITSPLAMAICSMLGADASLAIAIVVVTGVIGANFGATALDALGVKDPAARGLAQGGSAHGLGTAAMVNEPTAFAFSAVAMALTATASTVLVSIPSVRAALLSVALGTASASLTP